MLPSASAVSAMMSLATKLLNLVVPQVGSVFSGEAPELDSGDDPSVLEIEFVGDDRDVGAGLRLGVGAFQDPHVVLQRRDVLLQRVHVGGQEIESPGRLRGEFREQGGQFEQLLSEQCWRSTVRHSGCRSSAVRMSCKLRTGTSAGAVVAIVPSSFYAAYVLLGIRAGADLPGLGRSSKPRSTPRGPARRCACRFRPLPGRRRHPGPLEDHGRGNPREPSPPTANTTR